MLQIYQGKIADRPFLYCDACGRRICKTDAQHAIAQWNDDGHIVFGHQGCAMHLDEKYPEHLAWTKLPDFLHMLLNNLGIDGKPSWFMQRFGAGAA
jgi:hypothetical protein